MIRIVIVDDHELIREGIKKIIHSSGDMHVIGEAVSIADTLRIVDQLRPDIIVLDIGLQDNDGLEGLKQIRARYSAVPILVLSMYPEERFALRALKMGAAGYVTKNMAAEELVRAIRKITSGGTYISTGLADIMASHLRTPEPPPPHLALTERELQVVRMFGAGKAAKQIAAELAISISTVNTYRARIFQKMQLPSTAALIRYAVEHNLVDKAP